MLSKPEVVALFPGGEVHEERLMGLTKSFVVYGGRQWGAEPPN